MRWRVKAARCPWSAPLPGSSAKLEPALLRTCSCATSTSTCRRWTTAAWSLWPTAACRSRLTPPLVSPVRADGAPRPGANQRSTQQPLPSRLGKCRARRKTLFLHWPASRYAQWRPVFKVAPGSTGTPQTNARETQTEPRKQGGPPTRHAAAQERHCQEAGARSSARKWQHGAFCSSWRTVFPARSGSLQWMAGRLQAHEAQDAADACSGAARSLCRGASCDCRTATCGGWPPSPNSIVPKRLCNAASHCTTGQEGPEGGSSVSSWARTNASPPKGAPRTVIPCSAAGIWGLPHHTSAALMSARPGGSAAAAFHTRAVAKRCDRKNAWLVHTILLHVK